MASQRVRRFIPARRDQAQSPGSYRDYLVAIPFLLTAGALTFDVGYFSGVDINFFTLFSLSEHVLFALEALPSVFAVVFIGSLFIFWIRSRNWSLGGLGLRLHSDAWLWLRLLLAIGLYFAMIAIVFFFGVNYVVAIVGYLFVFIAAVLLAPRLLTDRITLSLLAAVVALFAIFFLGMFISRSYVQNTEIDHQLRMMDGVVQGKVIRSGERGMLFVDVINHRVRFHKMGPSERVEYGAAFLARSLIGFVW